LEKFCCCFESFRLKKFGGLASVCPHCFGFLAFALGRAFTSSLLMAAFPCSAGCGSQPMATTAEVSMFLCMAAAT
jgi:hypothetical protein